MMTRRSAIGFLASGFGNRSWPFPPVLAVIALAGLLAASTAEVQAQATHSIFDAFDFGGGAAANPNNGWTFADGGLNPLTNFIDNWNEGDFGAGQPGWEGPPNAPHAGFAQVTADAAFFSGFDVSEGEIATHGASNVIYTPDASVGDPFTGQHSVSISGTIHHLREFGRSGSWFLSRNGNEILAAGTIDDSTLVFNDGPLSLATNATTVSDVVTISGDAFTGLSYNPGDFFNLTIGDQDFSAVDLTIESFTDPGNGFGEPIVRAQEAYYRFEEASGVDVFDSIRDEVHGMFRDVPEGMERSTDVPVATIPQTGAANTKAADLRQGGSILLNASKFIFDESTAGAEDGGATLEWYMKVPNDNSPDIAGPNGHTSIFWTNGLGQDSDRFNIFWDASFTGAQDSDRFISGDWRAPGSAGPHLIDGSVDGDPTTDPHANLVPLTEDEWHHIAIVRNDNTPGDTEDYDFTWEWYIDGELSPNHTVSTNVPTPSPDLLGWTIAGRPGFPFHGLLDEIRLTAGALSPNQFLNAMSIGIENPGDYNGDGVVDAADYTVYQDNLGSTIELPNDEIGGTIGQAHYDQWANNFGNMVASASGSAAAVPEPCSLVLIVLGLTGFVSGRRRVVLR